MSKDSPLYPVEASWTVGDTDAVWTPTLYEEDNTTPRNLNGCTVKLHAVGWKSRTAISAITASLTGTPTDGKASFDCSSIAAAPNGDMLFQCQIEIILANGKTRRYGSNGEPYFFHEISPAVG